VLLFAHAEPDCVVLGYAKGAEKQDTPEHQFQTSTSYPITSDVNPITGDLIVEEVDLVVAGSEPLSLRRFYNHHEVYEPRTGGWRYNPEHTLAANFEWSGQERFAALGDYDGTIVPFKPGTKANTYVFAKSEGYVHTGLDGRTHPLNSTLTYRKIGDPKDKKRWEWKAVVVDGSGRERHFLSTYHQWLNIKILEMHHSMWNRDVNVKIITPNVWTPYQIALEEERLPNGNIICYTYERWHRDKHYPSPPLLKSITAYNHNKTKKLGEISFCYAKDKHDNINKITVEGSDQRTVVLEHSSGMPKLLQSVSSPHQPKMIYKHQDTWIKNVELPEGRCITTEYKDGKVAAQYAPVGPQGEMCPIGKYLYYKDHTVIYDAEGHKKIMRFDNEKRPLCTEFYQGEQLYRIERTQWDDHGHMTRKSIEDADGHRVQITEHLYDENHNPILEKTGDGTSWYTIERSYSKDGFNLKLWERDDAGRETHYTYLPKTNLLTAELLYKDQKILKRTFYTYDDCAICIKTIIDDGQSQHPEDLQGITYRKITEIQPKQSCPCFGLPAIVSEKTIDASGQEKLLHQTRYTYTHFGKVLQEEHYDAEGMYCYSLTNTYDNHERLVSTTDALGHTTHYTYDANYNLTSISGPKPGKHQVMTYDKANRPIRMTEVVDGRTLIVEKHYDKLGRLVTAVDACGNSTCFTYDALGRQISTCYPDGAIERQEYDVLDRVIKTIDPKGYEVRTQYHFLGHPLAVFYADGQEEHFTYTSTGLTSTHQDTNGALSVMAYDALDHLVAIQVYSSSQHLLKTSQATYTAFCKLSDIDAEGVTTLYSYDYAGRKVREQKGLQNITYAYDSLGHLTHIDNGAFQAITDYDVAGHVVAKKIEDKGHLQFQENYRYDEDGNCCEKITPYGSFITCFNTQGKPVLTRDPLGHETTYQHLFDKTYSTLTTDPNKIQTYQSYDSRGREALYLKKNAEGQIISKYINHYDFNGNLIEQTHTVFDGTQETHSITHYWVYGPGNRLERLLEAGIKETKYIYDNRGKLHTLVKPNHVEMRYAWDDLGRLVRYSSSDFEDHYTYDREDRVISIHDAFSHTTTQRTYTLLGQIAEETLAHHLTCANAYDDLGRRTTLKLPDTSTVDYEYQGAYLAQVKRGSLCHTYTTRDLRGQPLHMHLPGSLGTYSIQRDALSRCKSILAPGYRAELYYDAVGNISKYAYQDALGAVTDTYMYDALQQLTQENAHTYHFDSLHNLLKKDHTTFLSNSLNQILQDDTYTYDANGNLTFDGTWTYTYDTQDRLISAEHGTTKITYTYDPFHRRLTRSVMSSEQQICLEHYLWDGDHEIGMLHNQELQELRILGEGLGAEIGAAVLYELEDKTYVPLHDHRGCVIALLDPSTRESLATYRYTAFGEECTTGLTSPWRFASKRSEKETGLIFFGRRYYQPQLGRWMTQDPQGFEDGPNLYAYLSNNPMNQFDPYGLTAHSFAETRNFISFCGLMWYGTCRSVEWTGANMLPVPYVRTVVESVGRYGAGDGFKTTSRYRSESYVESIPGRSIPHHSYTHTNGMLTLREDAKKQAQHISQTHGGIQVDLIYQGTEGFMMDLLGCCAAKLGMRTSFNKTWANYYKTKLANDPEHRFTTSVHSRGGTQLMNTGRLLSPDQKKHIDVLAYGSATLIPKDYFGSAENNLNLLDVVCMTNPLAYAMGMMSDKYYNINVLPAQTKCPRKAHGFLEETYADQVKASGDRFKEVFFNE